jgi:hypothetical protein
MKYNAFLSHNSKDKPAVEQIARALKNKGLNVWLDKWELVPGRPWMEALEEGLAGSESVIVFIGEAGFGKWENEEARLAITARVSDSPRRVIPVLLPGGTPEMLNSNRFLLRHTWVDFRAGLDDKLALHRLAAGIRDEAPGDMAKKTRKPIKTGRRLKQSELVRIFLAAPQDVNDERRIARKLVESINIAYPHLGFRLELTDWHEYILSPERKSQPIRKQDIFCGILWTRFDAPAKDRTSQFSASQEDFEDAIQLRKQNELLHLSFYRSRQMARADEVDARVADFFERNKLTGELARLPQTYETLNQFEEHLKADITQHLNDLSGESTIKTRQPPEVFDLGIKRAQIQDEILPFVNRENISEYVTLEQAPPFFLIDAPAGFGKTTLLKRLQEIYENLGWLNSYICINEQRTLEEISRQISESLGLELSGDFFGKSLARALVKKYQTEIANRTKRGFIIFLDIEKSWSQVLPMIDPLLVNFIPEVAEELRVLDFLTDRHNPFRMVLSGRYLTGKLSPSIPITLNHIKLTPLSYKHVFEAVQKHLEGRGVVQIDQLAAHLMYYTAGHPGCISRILRTYKEHGCPPPETFFNEHEEEIWKIVYAEVDDIRLGIAKNLRRVFDDISIFRYLDIGILKELLEKSPFLEFQDAYDLHDQLQQTYRLEPSWANGPFLRDSMTRKLIALRLLDETGATAFKHYCQSAQDICAERLSSPTTQQPDKWLIEYLYQFLQKSTGEIKDRQYRARLRDEFFGFTIQRSFDIFKQNREPREFRATIQNTFQEDLEFRFAVNYYLRDSLYVDDHNSPYEQLVRQLTQMF